MRKHEMDVVSLVFGVAMLVIAGSWLLAKVVDIDWPSFGWVLAGSMVLIGLFGAAAAIRAGSKS